MTTKRHTKEQIIAVLKDAQAGIGIQELCLNLGGGHLILLGVLFAGP